MLARLLGAPLLPLLLLLSPGCNDGRDRSGPSTLVLVSFDTLRRDHLPVYGYERDTAPTLSAFAERALVFDRAYAQDTNTNPSHTTMLTGLYPHTHGNLQNGALLRSGVPTLAEILRDAGFATGAFVSSTSMLDATSGLSRGFDEYDDRLDGQGRIDGCVTVERALRWLGGWRLADRSFLFVHLFDAHGPYEPPAGFAGTFRSQAPGERLERIPAYQESLDEQGELRRDLHGYVDRYDDVIRYADECFRRLLERIDLDDAVVLVVADHGETLGERYHKLDHGGSVFEEQIRIPLLVAAPGLEPGRSDAPVETVDLLPTLLDLLGVEPPSRLRLQGRSLAGLLQRREAGDPDRPLFASARAESDRYSDRLYVLDKRRRILSSRSGRWKLIVYPSAEGANSGGEDWVELYDLESDPGERSDVADRHADVVDALRALLRRWHADAVEPSASALTPELRERLRELGYGD
jgi:arylsulfatase